MFLEGVGLEQLEQALARAEPTLVATLGELFGTARQFDPAAPLAQLGKQFGA